MGAASRMRLLFLYENSPGCCGKFLKCVWLGPLIAALLSFFIVCSEKRCDWNKWRGRRYAIVYEDAAGMQSVIRRF